MGMHMVCVSGVLRGTASRYVAREAVRGTVCRHGGLQKWAGFAVCAIAIVLLADGFLFARDVSLCRHGEDTYVRRAS